jgi:cyclic pyranopterin phosphate synthase
MESSPPGVLTHLDSHGAARMVDVADRPASNRAATAEGFLTMAPATLALVREGTAPKGDVLAVARVAAIQGAKRTAELIPLCHPLPLAGVAVEIEAAADGSGLRLVASVRTTAATGVEMEALTAVQVGLLTLYDMLKAVDPAMTIGPVRLLEKQGGRHGPWRHPAATTGAGGATSPGLGTTHG